MATTSGLVYDFTKFDLVIGTSPGFRVDAYEAGVDVAWVSTQYSVAPGADNNQVIVRTGSTNATMAVSLMQSARFLDYVTAWLAAQVVRPLTFEDRGGRTFMTCARAVPEQQPGMTFNASHNARSINILLPNLLGVVGGLREE